MGPSLPSFFFLLALGSGYY